MNRRQQDRLPMPSPLTILIALVVAFGAIGNFDYAEELDREAQAKVIRPQIAKQHPWDAPKCLKQNSAGEWLDMQIAHNPDARGWTFSCAYTEAKL